MISERIKALRENMGLSQAALAKRLGVTRASVNAWEMELSMPTAPYLVEMARLFHTDYILGLDKREHIVLDHLQPEEKKLIYSLMDYIESRKK